MKHKGKFIQNISMGNSYNNTVVNITGDNIVIVNGRIVSGNVYESKRTFRCEAEEEADCLIIKLKNHCSSLNITADESIERTTAEIKVTCSAKTKEQAGQAFEDFDIKAVTENDRGEKNLYFVESERPKKTGISAEYDIRIPKSVKELIIKQDTADIKIRGFEGTIFMQNDTGDISIKNCIIRKSQICNDTGDISFLDNEVHGRTSITNDTGDITVSVNGGDVSLNILTDTGNIRFLNLSNKVSEIGVVRYKDKFTGAEVCLKTNGIAVNAETETGDIIWTR